MFDDEVLTSPMFILLAAGSTIAVLGGWLLGKNWGLPSFPVWQVAIVVVGAWVASYVFASRE